MRANYTLRSILDDKKVKCHDHCFYMIIWKLWNFDKIIFLYKNVTNNIMERDCLANLKNLLSEDIERTNYIVNFNIK